jgi:hypothetical protein
MFEDGRTDEVVGGEGLCGRAGRRPSTRWRVVGGVWTVEVERVALALVGGVVPAPVGALVLLHAASATIARSATEQIPLAARAFATGSYRTRSRAG